MRTSTPPPETWPTPGTRARFVEIELSALTSIYKGGSTTDHIDEGRPFRVPSIRGMLRYWWRATSAISSVERLRTAEAKLFGGVFGNDPIASNMSVAVLKQTSKPGPCPGKPYAYAFGFTGNSLSGRQVHNDATGTLRVSWTDDATGVEAQRALQAWLLFGGLGGRSRRGAGSVWWDAGLDRPEQIAAYVALWKALTPQGPTKPQWPTLAGSVLLTGSGYPSADKAWLEALDGMRDVRASLDVRPGFVGRRGPDLLAWKRDDYIPISKRQSFKSKRAALGLPIRFNSRSNGFRGVMNADGLNRYPSPIHMKVIQIGAQYHPVMLVLRGPMPTKLIAGGIRGDVDPRGIDHYLDLATQLPGWTRYS